MEGIRGYPVLILCGSDPNRRELLRVLDPDENYPSKSLLPMHGRRVLDWQLDAICNSKSVIDIFLIGLSQDDFPCPHQIQYLPVSTTTTILEKIIVGSDVIQTKYPDLDHLIISTGDVPGMTTESVDCFFKALEQNIESDVLISGVPEEITSQYFPNHNRIVGRFTDCSIYPGEMMALRHKIIPTLMEEIDQLSRQRRKFDRRSDTSKLIPLFRYLSKKPKLWMMILRYLSGNISIKEIEKKLSAVYQMNFRCVIIPDPGFGMDLDLPEDFQKLSDYLSITKLQTQ
jgi:hypothetical protein